MRPWDKAPTGRTMKAQGNALGKRNKKDGAPTGRSSGSVGLWVGGSIGVWNNDAGADATMYMRLTARSPFQGSMQFGNMTQGGGEPPSAAIASALGFLRPPLWGSGHGKRFTMAPRTYGPTDPQADGVAHDDEDDSERTNRFDDEDDADGTIIQPPKRRID